MREKLARLFILFEKHYQKFIYKQIEFFIWKYVEIAHFVWVATKFVASVLWSRFSIVTRISKYTYK